MTNILRIEGDPVSWVVSDAQFDSVAQQLAQSGSLEELIKQDKVRKKLESEVEQHSASFKGFDKIKKFVLVAEDFTTQNDMLTPSLKLKRRNVLAKWGDQLDALYS